MFLNATTRASFVAAMILATGCAHTDLRRACQMGAFEDTNIKNVTDHAQAAFPIGMSKQNVLKQLGSSKGKVAPVVMFLTLRPWPFEPWRVYVKDSRQVVVYSECERSWLKYACREYLIFEFKFDEKDQLQSLEIRWNSIWL